MGTAEIRRVFQFAILLRHKVNFMHPDVFRGIFDIFFPEFLFASLQIPVAAGAGGFGNGAAPAPMPAGEGFMNIPDGIDEELPFN